MGEEDMIRDALAKEKIPLSELIRQDCLRVPFKVKSKGEGIWELIRTLHTAGYLKDPGRVLEIILERERQGGTTLGEGISILHGRLPDLKKPVVALGVLPKDKGIDMGGPDARPVDIIYLVLSPLENPKIHLQVLAAIAGLLSNKEARAKLRASKDQFEAMEVIKKFC